MYCLRNLRNKYVNICSLVRTMPLREMKTMKAWQAFGFGKPEDLKLSSLRIPILTNPTNLLVKIHAASINPLDLRMLEGYGASLFNSMRMVKNLLPFSRSSTQRFPLVLGRDFSGTVVQVGKCVKHLKCGDEVWGVISPEENGSHAEYALASSFCVSNKPRSLSHIQAASLPYAALTAWSSLCIFGGLSEGSINGKRVLVTGSSGGVGTVAVQLLKSWGAHVTATCSADAAEMLLNLGADQVLDYQSPEFKTALQELKDLDFIFDNVGKEYPGLTVDLLKTWRNCKYVTVVSPFLKNTDENGLLLGVLKSTVQAACDTVMSFKDGRSFRWAFFIPNGHALKVISELVEKDQIVPVIDEIFKFENLPQAYNKALQGHARGKTVIDFSEAEYTAEPPKRETGQMNP